MSGNQELFRAGVTRNLQQHPNGFDGMPWPIFDPPDGVLPHPIADALCTLDAVIADPGAFIEDPAKGAMVPVLGPLATRMSPNGQVRVQFLTAIGIHRITDGITPFRDVQVDPWTQQKSRILRMFFGTVALIEDIELDEGRLRLATYTAAVPPRS